jgi:ATP-dependent DNA ligase
MRLPVNPPVLPMLANRVSSLPPGEGWIFEPKWDGFRTLIFRDGDELFIQSRDEKPLDRYFPELIAPLKAQLPERCVVDGEIVIAKDSALDFEALQLRLHPAASRVKMLSGEIPASVIFFDLLSVGDRDLCKAPFRERRSALESLLANAVPPLHLTPATRDREVAQDWFRRFEGAGLDGVIAKAEAGTYEPNKRFMLKVKHERECDCVVAGFRWHKNSKGTALGSMLLGLFDDAGHLEHVGVCASFTAARRRELVDFLEPYRANALDGHPWRAWAEAMPDEEAAMHRRPGAVSRWSQGKDLSWEPLRPELVVQVAYDHMQGSRFRHTAQFRRWRPDKRPRDCTFAQLEVVPPHELTEIFATGR